MLVKYLKFNKNKWYKFILNRNIDKSYNFTLLKFKFFTLNLKKAEIFLIKLKIFSI